LTGSGNAPPPVIEDPVGQVAVPELFPGGLETILVLEK
jgi:hypothetical protein